MSCPTERGKVEQFPTESFDIAAAAEMESLMMTVEDGYVALVVIILALHHGSNVQLVFAQWHVQLSPAAANIKLDYLQ